MADLERDTAVVRTASTENRSEYTASVSEEWAIWGPMGGYIASIALRAAGHHCGRARPASINASFVASARFAPVDLLGLTRRLAPQTPRVLELPPLVVDLTRLDR